VSRSWLKQLQIADSVVTIRIIRRIVRGVQNVQLFGSSLGWVGLCL
jgi:hypothetical protein